jgi:hypothetical protein
MVAGTSSVRPGALVERTLSFGLAAGGSLRREQTVSTVDDKRRGAPDGVKRSGRGVSLWPARLTFVCMEQTVARFLYHT